jgi:hypothetical protein
MTCWPLKRPLYLGGALHSVVRHHAPGGNGPILNEPQVESHPVREHLFPAPSTTGQISRCYTRSWQTLVDCVGGEYGPALARTAPNDACAGLLHRMGAKGRAASQVAPRQLHVDVGPIMGEIGTPIRWIPHATFENEIGPYGDGLRRVSYQVELEIGLEAGSAPLLDWHAVRHATRPCA